MSSFKKSAFKNAGITCTAKRFAKRENHDLSSISKTGLLIIKS